MADKKEYFLVDSAVLPDVFERVVEAKKLIKSGACRTASEAVEKVKISRSAFYKYKDSVFTLGEMGQDKIITLFFDVLDRPGVLSGILFELSGANTSIITINQNIPVDNSASITISFRIENMTIEIDELIERLGSVDGVRKIKILAGK